MKKVLLSVALAFALLSSTDILAQQGFGTNEPDKSAAVDIVSTKRGLLIPRISIPDLDAAAPVNNPATSLFVYNTNTTTGEGFYYWDGAKWVRFISTDTEKDVIVAPGENVQVETEVSGNTTTYIVGVKGGTNDGQVLVTKIVGGETTTEWVNPNTFITEALTAGNAIGIAPDPDDPTKIEIKFDGTLSENTTIATGTHDLAITGLEDISDAFDADTHNIVVMGTDGVLKITSPKSLIEDVIENGGLEAKDLTTDGKIVVGMDPFDTISENAVLVATHLRILENSITSADIQNGTIQPVDIAAPGAPSLGEAGNINMVLVTGADGNVTWVNQSELANKDNYGFTAPLAKDAGTPNATGGMDYDVTIANANGTTVGVVKEADDNPTVNVVDGVLSVNLTHTTLSGDVTGPLNATVVQAIQGTDVSATAPTEVNNVLVYNDATSEWTPTALTGAHITGAAITSTSLDIPANTAALTALNIEIAPGTAAGQILTTTGTAPDLTTSWETVNSLVEVDNGLRKVTGDVIHLGGTLKEETEIFTSAANTLAITGLTIPAGASEIVYTQAADGILRKVARSISEEITATQNVNAITGYNDFVQEINISATIGGADLDVVLPDASATNKGQVVNIKIANTTEPTFYLNIKVGTATLTYGAMPYQGWIVKSNGTDWVIVGRN